MNLLSDEYREQIQDLHSRTAWGNGGHIHLNRIAALRADERFKRQIRSVLDYGCGKGAIIDNFAKDPYWVNIRLSRYDPGMPKFSALPEPADLVICTDVLEHVEPDHLDEVVEHLHSLTNVVAYVVPHTGPAKQILPDGRNAHLIQKPEAWWIEKLKEHFFHAEHLWGGAIRPAILCLP